MNLIYLREDLILSMKLTTALIFINILVYVSTSLGGLNYFIIKYGFQTDEFLNGDYYRIITSLFLHANVAHLGFNMLALLLLGSSLEKKVSPIRYLTVYFVGGIIGNLAMFIPFFYSKDSIGVGASGAISALVGLGTFLCPGKLVIFPAVLPLPFVVAGASYFLLTATNLFTPSEIGYSVHMVGMIIGMIFGLIWSKNWIRGILIFILALVLIIILPFILAMIF
jgi:rhomboid protease GluP